MPPVEAPSLRAGRKPAARAAGRNVVPGRDAGEMSRYRLTPTPAQESALREHCAQARFVWNLAVEQQAWYGRAGRGPAPGWAAQCRQLTEARHANPWLADGSVLVQQQPLRDFRQPMANFFASAHRKPTWRKPGHVRRLNRHAAAVLVPKVGWVRFRLSRPVPAPRL